MKSQQRHALRMARILQQQFVAPPRVIDLPVAEWQACQRLQRQIHRARQHGFELAVRKLEARWPAALQALQSRLPPGRDSPQTSVPDLRFLYDEICGLQAEFGAWTCDLAAGTLSVRTEPLQFDDLEPGVYEIRLHLRKLNWPGACRILGGLPASADPDVTHPHVRSEQLCAGEGANALQTALDSGRISDFFVIVASILRTFNSDSAYVDLNHWHGSTCESCGDIVPEEDQVRCPDCDHELCRDCLQRCDDCGQLHCGGCLFECVACGEPQCHACLRTCEHTAELYCESCFEEREHEEPTNEWQNSQLPATPSQAVSTTSGP